MGVAATTTEAAMSAIQESLVQLRVSLTRIAARQEQMLVTMKKTTAALTPTATAPPTFVPGRDRALEKQTTKLSSPSLSSTDQVVGAGAPQADAIFASATPTRCSTLGSCINGSCNHVVVAFPTSGTTHLPATTTIEAGNNSLQGMGEACVNTPTGCSTHVLSWPRDDPGARDQDVGTDMSAEVLTHIGGLSLFQEVELNFVDEVFNDSRLKDVMWYEKLADCVITHIGRSSLFLEQDTHHELEGEIDKTTYLEHAIGGVQVVFLAVLSQECKLQQVLLSGMQYGSTNASFSLSWDPGGFSLQIDPSMLIFPWDPGNLLRFFQFTTSNQSLVIPSAEGKWQQLLPVEMQPGTSMAMLFLPWDPGALIIFAEETKLSTVATSYSGDKSFVCYWPITSSMKLKQTPQGVTLKLLIEDMQTVFGCPVSRYPLPICSDGSRSCFQCLFTGCQKMVVRCLALVPCINPAACPPWRQPDRATHKAMLPYIQSAAMLLNASGNLSQLHNNLSTSRTILIVFLLKVFSDKAEFPWEITWPPQGLCARLSLWKASFSGPQRRQICSGLFGFVRKNYVPEFSAQPASASNWKFSFQLWWKHQACHCIQWIAKKHYGILLCMGMYIPDHGYALHSNQQSKLHTPQFGFLMGSSRYVQMSWDPGDIHSSALSSRLVQSIVCVVLSRPWDPGIFTIHESVSYLIAQGVRMPFGTGSTNTRCQISELLRRFIHKCCLQAVLQTDRAIAWGQAMFLGGGNVMPVCYATLGAVDMGRGLAAMGLEFGVVTIRRNVRVRSEDIEQNRT